MYFYFRALRSPPDLELNKTFFYGPIPANMFWGGVALNRCSTNSLHLEPKSIGVPEEPVSIADLPDVSLMRILVIIVRPQTSLKTFRAAWSPVPKLLREKLFK